ncbi:hypothetical protein, partial [Pseudomonas tussilaginis]|uniref:hypothetical protein n=1 Tax=Pseudomonas putida TaxID=303 RepID=UPI0023648C07
LLHQLIIKCSVGPVGFIRCPFQCQPKHVSTAIASLPHASRILNLQFKYRTGRGAIYPDLPQSVLLLRGVSKIRWAESISWSFRQRSKER